MKKQDTKKILKTIISFGLAIIMSFSIVTAHSGRTDSSGGHYNRSTGEYHYHHGYSAHQHENGICPYDYNDKTSSNFSTSNSTSTNKNTTNKETPTLGDIIEIIIYIFIVTPWALALFAWIIEKFIWLVKLIIKFCNWIKNKLVKK